MNKRCFGTKEFSNVRVCPECELFEECKVAMPKKARPIYNFMPQEEIIRLRKNFKDWAKE